MNYIWYAADSPSKHHPIYQVYHSLTGNEWLDALIVAFILLLPLILIIWYLEKK